MIIENKSFQFGRDDAVNILQHPFFFEENSTYTLTKFPGRTFETLVKYNAIFGTSKIKEVFDVIPDTSDAFDEMLSALRETIQAENAKYQEAERQRQQRERELAEQKRREEDKRKEKERQAEIEKKQRADFQYKSIYTRQYRK